MKDLLFYAVPAMGIVGLLYTLLKFNWVSKQDAGNDRMKEIKSGVENPRLFCGNCCSIIRVYGY